MILGMLSMGVKIPERRKAGIIKINEVIIACCCVRDMVEIRVPELKVVRMKMKDTNKRKTILPLIGRLKISLPAIRTRITSQNPTKMKGIVFPIISSIGFIGETISCSSVPISLSLVIAIEVRMRVVMSRMRHITPGTMK